MMTNVSEGPDPKPKESNAKSLSAKKNGSAPIFTEEENATLAQCIEILDWFHTNRENQSKTTQHFNPIYPNLKIKQPLVSAWVKDEAKWRDDWMCSEGLGS